MKIEACTLTLKSAMIMSIIATFSKIREGGTVRVEVFYFASVKSNKEAEQRGESAFVRIRRVLRHLTLTSAEAAMASSVDYSYNFSVRVYGFF